MLYGPGKVSNGHGKGSDGHRKVSYGLGKVLDGLGRLSDGLRNDSDGLGKGQMVLGKYQLTVRRCMIVKHIPAYSSLLQTFPAYYILFQPSSLLLYSIIILHLIYSPTL